MGRRHSKPQPPPPRHDPGPPPPPPPPPPLLDQPWRKMNWGPDKRVDLNYVRDYSPATEGQQIRILLYGPVGSGKSSLINSVQSALTGRISTRALVDNTSGHSFTKKYTTYRIRKGPGTFYPFVFNDIMGLERGRGVLVDDLKLALSGHVKDGYRFNPDSKMSKGDQYYNQSPGDNDKVHVLACVVPADTATDMMDEVVQKIRDVRAEASDLGIPQVVLLTKIDQACPEMKDIRNVYKAKYVKEEMEQFSVDVGFPMNCIFPVKNYHSEIDIDDDIDALVLSAMRRIIDFGDDFLSYN